jgi:hypothetical protein
MPEAPGDAGSAAAIGLCATCSFGRLFRSGRGITYVSCERSRTDPAYPRFPSIPMLRCKGFEPRDEDPGSCANPDP